MLGLWYGLGISAASNWVCKPQGISYAANKLAPEADHQRVSQQAKVVNNAAIVESPLCITA